MQWLVDYSVHIIWKKHTLLHKLTDISRKLCLNTYRRVIHNTTFHWEANILSPYLYELFEHINYNGVLLILLTGHTVAETQLL